MTENVIEIKNVTRTFGKTTAMDDVSLSIPKGSVFGLVGENGAGKTTLIKHVLGLLKAQSGHVSVFGMNPVDQPAAVLSRIGYLSEIRDMPDWMKIGQLLKYMRGFYPDWDDGFAEELRRTFELDAGQKIKGLSRGQRARVGLLTALAHRPELLLLDEPSSGLDPIVRRDILAAIIRTVADEGRTVLFSSHLLDEVERVADNVAMIHSGKLIISDTLESVLSSHRRLTLRFNELQSDTPQLPGSLSCSGEGREWTVICNGEMEELKQAVIDRDAQVISEDSASLDEIFVAHVNPSTTPHRPRVGGKMT